MKLTIKSVAFWGILLVLVFADISYAEVKWLDISAGKMGPNPVPGGSERAGQSYVCRDDAGVPGKLISGKCYVPLGGNEFENLYYDVLDMEPGTYEWQRYTGRFPANAIWSGSEGRGKDIYVCRSVPSLGSNIFIGKFIPWLADCYYGADGDEEVTKQFDVLVEKSVSETEVKWLDMSAGKMGPNPVPGGREKAGQSYVCRDDAGVPGKLISGKCYVPLGGNEFENLYYDVLDMEPGTYEWQRYTGRFPANAIWSGSEGRGKDIYVCRTEVLSLLSTNIFIGKFIPWLADCYYGVDGDEDVAKQFDVLVKKSPASNNWDTQNIVWRKVGYPHSARKIAACSDGSLVAMNADKGFYVNRKRGVDDGWSRINTLPSNASNIACGPGNVGYFQTSDRDLWRIEGPNKFTKVGRPYGAAEISGSGTELWALNDDKKLWRNRAGGDDRSWEQVGYPHSASKIAVAPNVIFALNVDKTLWRNRAGGGDRSWEYLGKPLTAIEIAAASGQGSVSAFLYVLDKDYVLWEGEVAGQ